MFSVAIYAEATGPDEFHPFAAQMLKTIDAVNKQEEKTFDLRKQKLFLFKLREFKRKHSGIDVGLPTMKHGLGDKKMNAWFFDTTLEDLHKNQYDVVFFSFKWPDSSVNGYLDVLNDKHVIKALLNREEEYAWLDDMCLCSSLGWEPKVMPFIPFYSKVFTYDHEDFSYYFSFWSFFEYLVGGLTDLEKGTSIPELEWNLQLLFKKVKTVFCVQRCVNRYCELTGKTLYDVLRHKRFEIMEDSALEGKKSSLLLLRGEYFALFSPDAEIAEWSSEHENKVYLIKEPGIGDIDDYVYKAFESCVELLAKVMKGINPMFVDKDKYRKFGSDIKALSKLLKEVIVVQKPEEVEF